MSLSLNRVTKVSLASYRPSSGRLLRRKGALLRHGKDAAQVFLGLADVLADDRAQVDTVQVTVQVVGEHSSSDWLRCFGDNS